MFSPFTHRSVGKGVIICWDVTPFGLLYVFPSFPITILRPRNTRKVDFIDSQDGGSRLLQKLRCLTNRHGVVSQNT